MSDSVVVKMDLVLRQDNPSFLKTLHNIRNGVVDDEDVAFILSRCYDKFNTEEKSSFDNAIHLVPIWKMTDKIIYDYLMSLTSPISKLRPIYNSIRTNGENHCFSETSYPVKITLCEGAQVMLLKNYIVELNLMNGSVGIIKKIVYENKNGLYDAICFFGKLFSFGNGSHNTNHLWFI